MNEIILNLCTYLAIATPGMKPDGCLAALNSAYIQSGGKSTYDMTESYYQKKGEGLIRDNVNDKLIDAGIGAYYIKDVIQKQEIKLEAKCNMLLCDTIGLDLKNQIQTYNLGWKWTF